MLPHFFFNKKENAKHQLELINEWVFYLIHVKKQQLHSFIRLYQAVYENDLKPT